MRAHKVGRKNFFREAGVEAYCVKCRATRTMQAPQQVTLKNGRPASRGKCATCGTNMYRIGAAK